MGDVGGAAAGGGGVKVNRSHVLFDNFVQASTCKGTLKAFQELCDYLDLQQPSDCRIFYHRLKSKLNYWKAKALWAKLDKRAGHKEYKKGRACVNSKVGASHHDVRIEKAWNDPFDKPCFEEGLLCVCVCVCVCVCARALSILLSNGIISQSQYLST